MMRYILVCIYLLLTTSGLILMKYGGNSGSVSVKNKNFEFNMSLISLFGFGCYLLSFLMFTQIVMMFDLSFIFPVTVAIVQVLALLASIFIFKEKVNRYGMIGTGIVIVGIVMMNL